MTVALRWTPLLSVLAATVVAGCGGRAAPERNPDGGTAAAGAMTPAADAASAARRSSRAIVWAVGDGADATPAGRRAARRVADRIARLGVDRLLYLGDVYEDGTAAEFRRAYAPTYGRFARRTTPTPGNHEWANRRTGYDPYWKRMTGRAPTYSALRLGGWEIVQLNSQAPHDDGSAELRWLRRQVRAPGDCRIAFWHEPRFSAGPHGDQGHVAPLWEALRGRARLVLSGHDHDLQRFKPRDGLVQMVSGAGGRGLYPLSEHAGLAFGDDRHFGALRLDLRPGVARFAFVTASGRILDHGRTTCRRG